MSVLATLMNFLAVCLLGDLITALTTTTTREILTYYLPLLVAVKVLDEVLDYFTRRYGETFPKVYGDFVALRLSLSVLKLSAQRIANLSPQRLQLLIGKYAGNVASFADAWFWTISRRITELVLTICVLANQSGYVLIFNVVYFTVFLWIALRISRRFSAIAARYSEQDLNSSSTISGFLVNLTAVRRLGISDFFLYNFSTELGKKWMRFDEVRNFHARRWFLQLNLYNFGYVATLLYGAFQVQQGQLSLGFLVLIKYAFDTLYHIFVWVIEYYVALIQQCEDGLVIRREFAGLQGNKSIVGVRDVSKWTELKISNLTLSFQPSSTGDSAFTATIPELTANRRSKIGIIGASGSGKSALISAILNLVEYQGEYSIDGVSVSGMELDPPGEFSLINNTDPLFPISLRDNLALGRDISDEKLNQTLAIVCASEFTKDLNATVGSVNFNLSSGQQQRIRLARGLLQEASLYLLDEPFNGIDEPTKLIILENLRTFFEEKALILVTHNPDELVLVNEVYEFKSNILEHRL